jgi:hypothetical protein
LPLAALRSAWLCEVVLGTVVAATIRSEVIGDDQEP